MKAGTEDGPERTPYPVGRRGQAFFQLLFADAAFSGSLKQVG